MIVAVDFDGILCRDAFPDIGEPNYEMISLIREIIDAGHEVVLWTCRVDQRLVEAVEWCHDRGLYFCAVNDNAPSNKAKYGKEYPNGTRKVYADLYVDDKSCWFQAVAGGLWTSFGGSGGPEEALNQTMKYVRKVVFDD